MAKINFTINKNNVENVLFIVRWREKQFLFAFSHRCLKQFNSNLFSLRTKERPVFHFFIIIVIIKYAKLIENTNRRSFPSFPISAIVVPNIFSCSHFRLSMASLLASLSFSSVQPLCCLSPLFLSSHPPLYLSAPLEPMDRQWDAIYTYQCYHS